MYENETKNKKKWKINNDKKLFDLPLFQTLFGVDVKV